MELTEFIKVLTTAEIRELPHGILESLTHYIDAELARRKAVLRQEAMWGKTVKPVHTEFHPGCHCDFCNHPEKFSHV